MILVEFISLLLTMIEFQLGKIKCVVPHRV